MWKTYWRIIRKKQQVDLEKLLNNNNSNVTKREFDLCRFTGFEKKELHIIFFFGNLTFVGSKEK